MSTPAPTTPRETARDVERSVRRHPVPVCADFVPGDRECTAFWCQTCHWNEPLHRDDDFRAAVATTLQSLAAAAAPTTTHTPEELNP